MHCPEEQLPRTKRRVILQADDNCMHNCRRDCRGSDANTGVSNNGYIHCLMGVYLDISITGTMLAPAQYVQYCNRASWCMSIINRGARKSC